MLKIKDFKVLIEKFNFELKQVNFEWNQLKLKIEISKNCDLNLYFDNYNWMTYTLISSNINKKIFDKVYEFLNQVKESIKKHTISVSDDETSYMVRGKGLEPLCRKALEPKSSASANFATRAY